ILRRWLAPTARPSLAYMLAEVSLRACLVRPAPKATPPATAYSLRSDLAVSPVSTPRRRLLWRPKLRSVHQDVDHTRCGRRLVVSQHISCIAVPTDYGGVCRRDPGVH